MIQLYIFIHQVYRTLLSMVFLWSPGTWPRKWTRSRRPPKVRWTRRAGNPAINLPWLGMVWIPKMVMTWGKCMTLGLPHSPVGPMMTWRPTSLLDFLTWDDPKWLSDFFWLTLQGLLQGLNDKQICGGQGGGSRLHLFWRWLLRGYFGVQTLMSYHHRY